MNSPKNSLYEEFHSNTKEQQRIISTSNFTYRTILKIINKYLTQDKTLDIGCGAGSVDLYLGSKGYSTIGIDISKIAIKAATNSANVLKLDNIKFQVVKFPEEVPSGKYKNIICFEVIAHLPNDYLALQKIYNLLEKDGIAIISTPSLNAPLYRLGLTDSFDKRVGHLRRYSLKELVKKVEELGFYVIDTYRTEGIIRNYLFINPTAGKFVRFIKGPLVGFVSIIDDLSLKLFGESDLFLILQKQ